VRWLPKAARAPLRRSYAALGAGLAHGSRIVARVRRRSESYDCVIGVDPDGLVLAHDLANGAPVGYYSLELLLSSEMSAAEAGLKAQERTLSRAAPFVIVQDAARARLLAEDNALDPGRVVLVPNAPPGPARRQPSRTWHQKFGLAEDRRIVLHAGSLGDWTGIEDIVRGVPDWPAPWVLVIHTRYAAESSPYVERLRAQADPERVLFSLNPVDRQAYDTMIDGADVGLAFYVASGARRLPRPISRRSVCPRASWLTICAPGCRSSSIAPRRLAMRSRQPGVAWPSRMRRGLARRSIRSARITSASAPVPASFSTSISFFPARSLR
jgi:hypothetical protein